MRGMKKWLPFKSLNGQYEVLNQMKEKRKEVEKPLLSDDEKEAINNVLIELKKGDNVLIEFYQNRKIEKESDVFLFVDTINKKIHLKSKNINLENLLSIEIL